MNLRKSIMIAGASSGIGAALTRALAKDGHNLFVCARRADRLANVLNEYPCAFYAPCDVGQETEVRKFFQQIKERTNHIDVLIHCAGILKPIGLFFEVDSEEWLASLRVNLFGAFLMAKHVVPLMKAERRPRIILLSGGGAYGVSKAAIVRLVETLAIELAPRNIAVNAVAPGFLATDIHAETLTAGPERAGEHYDTTVKLLAEWEDGMQTPIDCIRYMISEASAKLSGKTISARHDPWGSPEFDQQIDAIMASSLYTTKRITHADIDDATLAVALNMALNKVRNTRQKR
jgi:NAD(P)-dependent dehydrogenase (short-subunit alcohol dehydrogenase family)